MKKTVIVTLLLVASSTIGYSQSINMPVIPEDGVTIKFDQIDETVSFDSSPPWDFSSQTVASEYSMSVLPVDASSSASNYPNATHVLQSDNGEFFLGYESNSVTSYGKIGTSTTTNYSTPLVLVNFPISSSTVHADSIESSVEWMGLTADATDKMEVTGIASGSVTMPDGTTYENAVLLSTKRTTVYGPSPLDTYLEIEEITHQWWVENCPIPAIEVLEAYSNESLVLSRTLFLKTETSDIKTHDFKANDLHMVVDINGKQSGVKTNIPQLYIYKNGMVKKKVIVE